MFQFFPHVSIIIVSFLLTFFVSIYAYKYKENLGVKEFILAMSAGSFWILCQCLELMATDFTIKYIFSSILYIGSGMAVFSYFLLSLCFTGKSHLLKMKHKVIMIIMFLIFFILIITDIKFGLMRTNFGMDTSNNPYVITKNYSTLYPVYMLYVHSMTLFSIIILFISSIKGDKLYRRQAAILCVGLVIIVASSIIYSADVFGEMRFDSTPSIFGVAVSIYFFGIYKHKLFSIIPVSRNILVDIMDSGLLVIDKNNNIIDVNQKFLNIFELKVNEIVGKKIENITLLNDISNMTEDIKEIDFLNKTSYKLRIRKHIFKINKINSAEMFIVDDITEETFINQKMLKQQATLSIMNEREKIARDLHDGFGQIFGYISIQSQTVKEYLAQNNIEKANEKLEELITIAKYSHEDIRALILQMQGNTQKNRNFRIAFLEYVDEFRKKFNMTLNVDFDENLPKCFPNDDEAFQITKIVRESFNNIINHAGNCQVNILFRNVLDDTIITIEDNGIGFDINDSDNLKGYGLSIMRERAKEVGAKLEIESHIGMGTQVKIIFKMRDEHEDINCG